MGSQALDVLGHRRYLTASALTVPVTGARATSNSSEPLALTSCSILVLTPLTASAGLGIAAVVPMKARRGAMNKAEEANFIVEYLGTREFG